MGVNNNFELKLTQWKQDFAFAETGVLNIMDDTIILTPISATLRNLMAWVQGIASLGFAINYANEGRKASSDGERQKLLDKSVSCLDITYHAGLNYGRSMVAAVPIVGAIALIGYDWILSQRVKYEGETANPVKAKLIQVYKDYEPMSRPYVEQAKKGAGDIAAELNARFARV